MNLRYGERLTTALTRVVGIGLPFVVTYSLRAGELAIAAGQPAFVQAATVSSGHNLDCGVIAESLRNAPNSAACSTNGSPQPNRDAVTAPASANFAGRSSDFATREATARIHCGEDLAERGAIYAARAKFVEALATIALGLDSNAGDQLHSHALAAGLKAMDEADDFLRIDPSTSSSVNLTTIVAKHQTPVLQGVNLDQLSRLAAAQRYLTYARDQLIRGCGHGPTASKVLSSLGRAWSVQPSAEQSAKKNGTAKAIILHQAALVVDPQNYMAANELGVLMARCGQIDKALELLCNSLKISETPEALYNISRVFEQSGDARQAKRARDQYIKLAGYSQKDGTINPPSNSLPSIHWVGPAEFAEAGGRVSQTEVTIDKPEPSDAASAVNQKPRVPVQRERGRPPAFLSTKFHELGSMFKRASASDAALPPAIR